ncbi:MAG: HEAT repeat domain-containing protein [Phycisphaerae bacterium]
MAWQRVIAGRFFNAAAAGVVLAWGGATFADEVHLLNGLVVEGDTLEEGGEVLRLKTPSGELLVPRGVIVRVTQGPTRWTRYARERARRPMSARRHIELAQWCRQNGLAHYSREHLRKALEMDPAMPEALEANGYVRLGDVWIKTGAELHRLKTGATGQGGMEGSRDQGIKIVEQLLQGWLLRVRSIREGFLKTAGGRDGARSGFEEGRRRILALSDPLALPAICKVLSEHDTRSRRLLAEVLAQSDSDSALLNLLALALLDDEETVRTEAAGALAERRDPRVSEALRLALTCQVDPVVRRSADALGTMRDRSAVPELIDALNADPKAQAGPDISRLFELIASKLNGPIEVPLGERGATYPSKVAVVWLDRATSRKAGKARRRAGLRTEVQEALIAITGQNYGFDTDAWKIWLRQNPPLPPIG